MNQAARANIRGLDFPAFPQAESRALAFQVNADLVRERNFADVAINSLPGLFYALDDRGGFLRWNKALEQVTGYSSEEISAMNALQFFAPADHSLIAQRIEEVFLKGHSSADVPLLTKTGLQIPYFFTGKRCFVEGRPILVGMGLDVTEPKRVEAELREARNRLAVHAEELEKSVADRTRNLVASIESLEKVLYHVAHDLRSPLRTMQGFTTILQEDKWGLQGEGRDYARRVAEAASRMDKLIQDLLAYGHMAHTPLQLSKVDVNKQMQDVLDQFAGEIKSRQAIVEVQGPLLEVYADSSILGTLLGHLFSNALRFVAPGVAPKIQIRTEQLTPASVRLSMRDNGVGVSPEHHERIFCVFERLEAAGVSNGTGIGLAMVKKGAERMGGTAGLESGLGTGSCFWLDLPAPPCNLRMARLIDEQ